MNWKHIWHTVRKDIHAQRFHLAVWAALTLVSVGILAQPELDLANGPIALMTPVMLSVLALWAGVTAMGDQANLRKLLGEDREGREV